MRFCWPPAIATDNRLTLLLWTHSSKRLSTARQSQIRAVSRVSEARKLLEARAAELQGATAILTLNIVHVVGRPGAVVLLFVHNLRNICSQKRVTGDPQGCSIRDSPASRRQKKSLRLPLSKLASHKTLVPSSNASCILQDALQPRACR